MLLRSYDFIVNISIVKTYGHKIHTYNYMTSTIDFKKKSETRYKTELCKKWEGGFCEFGGKCAFAHGVQEIRGKYFYKTKKCKQFFENGCCMFGNKCIFQHLECNSSLEGSSRSDVLPICKAEKGLQQSHPKHRLPIFQQICQN